MAPATQVWAELHLVPTVRTVVWQGPNPWEWAGRGTRVWATRGPQVSPAVRALNADAGPHTTGASWSHSLESSRQVEAKVFWDFNCNGLRNLCLLGEK